MDINSIQRQIAKLRNNLNEIGLDSYYDNEYTFRIKNEEYDVAATLNTLDDEKDDSLFISLSNVQEEKNNNVIFFKDVEELIKLKENCDGNIFNKIVKYVFFKKNNTFFFEIINELSIKNAEVIQEMIENEEINKTENEITPSIVNRNQEISNYIIDFLNRELSNFGTRKFNKNKRYYISEDNDVAVLVMRSKRYDREPYKYWYTFHKYQKDILEKYKISYIMLYFDDKDECILIETEKLYSTLSKLGKTQHGDNIGWHLHIQDSNGIYSIRIPYEGLLNINQDGSLKMQPFEKRKHNNGLYNQINNNNLNDVLDSNNNIPKTTDENITLKIFYDDFKVIKFRNK